MLLFLVISLDRNTLIYVLFAEFCVLFYLGLRSARKVVGGKDERLSVGSFSVILWMFSKLYSDIFFFWYSNL